MKNTGQAKVDEVQAYLERFFSGQVSRSVAQGEAAYAFCVEVGTTLIHVDADGIHVVPRSRSA